MTALDDHTDWAAVLKANRKTLLCPAEHADTVREAADLSGVGTFYDVQPCDLPGAVFIVKEQP